MSFSIKNFSFDDTQNRATIILMDRDSDIINCTFRLDIQQDESIGGIKRKAMAALGDLTQRAVKDALEAMKEAPQ